jgi:hypothetical protein
MRSCAGCERARVAVEIAAFSSAIYASHTSTVASFISENLYNHGQPAREKVDAFEFSDRVAAQFNTQQLTRIKGALIRLEPERFWSAAQRPRPAPS